MKKKYTIAIIGILVILSFLAFIGLSIINGMRFWDSMSQIYVYSEDQIVKKAEGNFRWRIPEKATNLYYAHDSGLDIHSFFALTLPNEKGCEDFLKLWFNASFSDFKCTLELPEKYLRGPGGNWDWPVENKENWDITKYKEYYIYDDYNTRRLEIVYVPVYCRIFVFKDYPD